jgi:stage II sporulation protein AA (anti-sigma F factor antagonist)
MAVISRDVWAAPDLPVPFSCEIVPDPLGVRILVGGEVDLTNARHFEARLCAARHVGARRLLLDLSGTTYMDSTGLRIVLRWHDESLSEGFDARITAVSDVVGRLIEVTDVSELLEYRAGA